MGFAAGAARIGVVLTIVMTAACRTGHNYVDPAVPRYVGGDTAEPVAHGGVSTLRVVSFNIEHAREIESATALLRDDPDLRHADVILLQEMDAPGVRRIALELALEYVYYPATGERRSQLRAVLADATDHARVIVVGDLNDAEIGRVASAGGFDWPTRRGRRTATLGRLDHTFSRGLGPAAGESSGTVLDNRGSSDHRPVWTVLSVGPDRFTAAERCDA
jgi:endonuclease/exonuclease/phosphatase (EEP) superfamily protein YafD